MSAEHELGMPAGDGPWYSVGQYGWESGRTVEDNFSFMTKTVNLKRVDYVII